MSASKHQQLQAESFGSIFFLAQHLGRIADETMAPTGVTTRQWLLLAILQRQFPQKPPTLSEAAAWYGSSRQNVKMIAQQLERQGFLKIKQDPEDRRALRLHVTPKAARLDNPSEHARQVRLLQQLFAWASEKDLESLAELLRRWAGEFFPKGGLS